MTGTLSDDTVFHADTWSRVEARATRAYPLLLATYPVLALYVAHSNTVAFGTAVLPVLLSFALAILASLVLYLWFRDSDKMVLGTAVFLIFFFCYGAFYSLFFTGLIALSATPEGMVPYANFGLHLHLLLSAGFLVLLVVAMRGIRTAGSARVRSINRFAVRMVAVLFMLLGGIHLLGASNGPADSESPLVPVEGALTSEPLGHLPDIYHIVLDGYARSDVLADHYGFDNEDFLQWLRERGFTIASHSRANYTWTFLSLTSTLNMDYVQRLIPRIDTGTKGWSSVEHLIDDNAVVRFLRARGYRHVHLASTWGPTYENRHADEELRCGQGPFLHEFNRALFEASWLRALEFVVAADLARCHLENFEILGGLATEPGPKYVFSHFIPPHHPYLFDRDGTILRGVTVANQLAVQGHLWADKVAYVAQLEFVNGKIRQVVTSLLEGSDPPPLIVIHSDHGPKVPELEWDPYVEARFANFVAAYLPNASPLPEDVSNVNLFRFVLNEYFEAGLSLLPDSAFDSGFDAPYRLEALEVAF